MSFSTHLLALFATFRAWRRAHLAAMAQAVPYPLTPEEWLLIQQEESVRDQALAAAAEAKHWAATSGRLAASYLRGGASL
jgi:hypothetical protein